MGRPRARTGEEIQVITKSLMLVLNEYIKHVPAITELSDWRYEELELKVDSILADLYFQGVDEGVEGNIKT